MILKKKINFAKFEVFNSKKISANAANSQYTLGLSGDIKEGEPDIMWQTICFIKNTKLIWTGGQLYDCVTNPTKVSELTNDSGYQKTVDADKKYIPKGTTSSLGSSISISTNGSFNNYGPNGQAFNAVRDLTGTTKYLGETGSGYVINAASFGVKDNGTTAFSHKKYDSFNPLTGAYTNARNTAVLVFSGKSGLLYAKNTGTASDVTDDMYKYVGVIDSPDEKLKVYSAKQVDQIVSDLNTEILKLKDALDDLGATT